MRFRFIEWASKKGAGLNQKPGLIETGFLTISILSLFVLAKAFMVAGEEFDHVNIF